MKLFVKGDRPLLGIIFGGFKTMPRKSAAPVGHAGKTAKGNTRDVKVERIGDVTIYKRGESYYLYYRENKKTQRRRIDGSLAVARATAGKVTSALVEHRPSPLGFERTSPQDMCAGYLGYVDSVQQLAWRTQDRYRAALDRFLEFCTDAELKAVDSVDERVVEDFVRWLRGQTRTRNGAKKGKRDVYAVGGVKFILSTCRTAFNWASRRRMLPPYSENPFSRFPIDSMRDADADDEGTLIFTAEQQQAFFAACNDWQRGIFQMLATYGMRAGELTNLLIENVDFAAQTIQICSKPELHWRVKTGRRRTLPMTKEVSALLGARIKNRKSGFVFVNEEFVTGSKAPKAKFASDTAFRQHLAQLDAALTRTNPEATGKDRRRAVTVFARSMGQIPVKRIQLEFCKLTETIGCPEFTRAHNLRHLFSSRAQEMGMNPLLVQEMLGHTTLAMTKRYTHIGMDAKRAALEKLNLSDEPNEEKSKSH